MNTPSPNAHTQLYHRCSHTHTLFTPHPPSPSTMPRVETDIKLDFKDVLIRPKRSTLKSRSEVNLDRTYVMKHSRQEWTGVPIMAANMDTTGASA